jgi:hypothetical protein
MNFWTPIKFLYNFGGSYYWLMRCICGKEKEVTLSNYKSNKTKSCGCQRKTSKIPQLNPIDMK